ncbi:hypothetical protein LCGC14_2569780, partial [marine sediment metagenome]
RDIERLCNENVVFMALSADSHPHFTTVATFIAQMSDVIQQLFTEVLMVCDDQGLIGGDMFAIDGCKLPSNASKEHSGTHADLTKKRKKINRAVKRMLAKHREEDASGQDNQHTRRTAEEKNIEELRKASRKIKKHLATTDDRRGINGKIVKSNITDNESAKMTTSKGTIQGYNGVATVDKKHQIIIDAQAFGEGQEHHTLQPVLETVEARYKKLGIAENLYQTGAIVTADTGFANEANMQYLHEQQINGYIPDNRFRSRDPKFADQKTKYGKRHQASNSDWKKVIPSSEFQFDPVTMTCICPAGKPLHYEGTRTDQAGVPRAHFQGRLLQCRHCPKKHQCMQNPESANHRKGKGRQVSYTLELKRGPTYTDWMKHRVDSPQGKEIYSHRMSVVEPVFGNIGTNKGLNRFSLRGREKVQGQWQLYCLVHNIEKLANYGQMAA